MPVAATPREYPAGRLMRKQDLGVSALRILAVNRRRRDPTSDSIPRP